MTKSQLRHIIFEAVKKSLKKKKLNRTAESYITSSGGEIPTLYINIKIEAEDMDCAEKCRKDILSDLEKIHEIKIQKET